MTFNNKDNGEQDNRSLKKISHFYNYWPHLLIIIFTAHVFLIKHFLLLFIFYQLNAALRW